MFRFLKASERAVLADAALDIGVAGSSVIRLHLARDQFRIGCKEAGRFDINDKIRARINFRQIARKHHADPVGEDFHACITVLDPFFDLRWGQVVLSGTFRNRCLALNNLKHQGALP